MSVNAVEKDQPLEQRGRVLLKGIEQPTKTEGSVDGKTLEILSKECETLLQGQNFWITTVFIPNDPR